MPNKTPTSIDIAGKQLQLSNLNKVYYPATGFTKAEVIDYYVRIAPALLPHLAKRPLTLKRFPGGVEGEFFYQKECPEHRPEWLETAPVYSEGNERDVNYCLVNDLPSLVWVANTASIELHTSLSLGQDPLTPEMVVFDLDPGPPANIIACSKVALWLRQGFEHLNLQSFPKTSGSKGLQVYIPLHTPVTYDQTKNFARAQARLLEEQHTELVVSKMSKSLRSGKVFVDWSQNDRHKTTVCVYSLRARSHPTVSAPVRWEEVELAVGKQDPQLLSFEAGQVVQRWQQLGDLFAPVLTLQQQLPA